MSSVANTSPCAEKIRAALACFRATEPHAEKLFVLLEVAHGGTSSFATPQNAQPPRRIVARRVYAGENKALEGRFTVVVGHDLASGQAQSPVALTIERNVDVTIAATPFEGSSPPFEGVFELKVLPIEKIR